MFTLFPSVISSTHYKVINSAFCAEVLKGKAWASITWVKVPTAYPATHFPFHTVLFLPVCTSSSGSQMESLLRSSMPEHTCSIVTMKSWHKSIWASSEAWRNMAGFKAVVTLSSTLSCSSRATWYFSILLAISNVLFFVPNQLLLCGAHISFCVICGSKQTPQLL